MLYNISILDDVDTILNCGDELIDPFNLLKVNSITADNGFLLFLFKNINIEKLYKETLDFDFEKWWYNLYNNLFITEHSKEVILRFSWLLCKNILSDSIAHKINISNLLNNSKKLLYINVYTYRYEDNYIFKFELENEFSLEIKFKDNNALL